MNIKELEIKEYKEVDDEIIEIMASDETIDRDNDIIRVDGWQTENWLKTGSLLYGHDPSSPFNVVGSAEGAEVRDRKLYLKSRLAKKGTSETHDMIRSLIKQKVLKGVSVGFKAIDYEQNDHGGLNFLKQELLEISLTPVPANANAMVMMKDMSEETKSELFPEKKIDLNTLSLKELNKYIKEQDSLEDKGQEETKVEPEPKTLSDKETRFLDLLNKIGEKYGR